MHQIMCHFYKLMICAVDKEIAPDFKEDALRSMGLDTVYNDLCSEIVSRKKKQNRLESEHKANTLTIDGLTIENGKKREMLVRCRREMAVYREQEEQKKEEFESLSDRHRREGLEAKQTIDALTNELDIGRTKMAEKEQEIEVLKRENVDHFGDRTKWEDTNQALKEAMVSQCTEWDELAKAMKQRFTENHKSQWIQTRKLQKERESLLKQQSTMKTQLQSMEHEDHKKEGQIRSLLDDAQHFEVKMKELVESKTQIQYQRESAMEELAALKLKYTESEDGRKGVIARFETLKSVQIENESEIKTLRNELKSVTARSGTLQQGQIGMAQKVEAMQHRYRQKEEAVDSLQSECRSLQSESNRMKQELILLANEHRFAVDHLEFERERIRSMKEDADHFRVRMDEMAESKTKSQYQSECAGDELAALRLEYAEREQETERVSQELGALKAVNIENEAEIKRLENVVKRFEAQSEALRQSQSELALRWEAMRSGFKQRGEAMDSLQTQNQSLQSEINRMKLEMGLLANRYQFAVDNVEFENQRGDDLQRQIQSARDELEVVLTNSRQKQREHLAEMKEAEHRTKIQCRKNRRILEMYKDLKRDVSRLKTTKRPTTVG